MTQLLAYFLTGLIIGIVLVSLIAIAHLRRWKQAAAELENQLRSHSFELQITLDELAEKNQQLEQQNQLDALSGIYNRAYFDRQMRAELKRSRREQRSLALVLLDIDHFKLINDKHGHLAHQNLLAD
jgi:PleD family two-component response regulator